MMKNRTLNHFGKNVLDRHFHMLVALTFFPLLVAALDCYSFCFSSKSDPEFLKLNPLALIPILVDGDFVLAESLAIIMYLDDKYPQYPLLPHDVPKRALNFQVAHIVLQNNVIEKKVGPHEKLPWAQSVIRKGFTALEKLLKDHAGRYATEDEIFLVLLL
ncbi:glutathione S-transferase 1-like [Arachis duranensis]|uniref:Glutathione S-transferase 1-like n=1 Tax=Arachis duranensis TaxID=130453 RepID=A0A9C6WTB9_ARADU|nr:glutathione S-transferase 1-like [Arachis duranensis]